MKKVVVVGCGNVGMSYAFSLISLNGQLDELVLIDINKEKADGEALDLTHGSIANNKRVKIYEGDYSDCKDANLICICAGANQKVGETRIDLLNKNKKIFENIIGEINKTAFSGVYLIATNPVDLMSYYTFKLSNFPAHKVIGSGTTLDTMRLRNMISDKLSVNSQNVHAYVIGEHGDSEFVAWSNAMMGFNNISDYIEEKERNLIEENVKNSAYDIIRKKGNTSYGIGACLAQITYDILENSHTVWPVSVFNVKHELYFGMPAVLGEDGVKEVFYLNLNEREEEKLQNSIDKLKNILNS